LDVFWGPAHRLPRTLQKTLLRVVSIHDLVWKYAPETMRGMTKTIEQYQMPAAIRQADCLFALSAATAQALSETFPGTEQKIHLLYPGVSFSDNIASRETLNIQTDYCLCVGTLEPRKNNLRLLEAYATLSDDHKNAMHLIFVGGDGWGNVAIESHLKRLNIQQYVHVLGYVDDQTLHGLYAHAAFLAMPSCYEGFGLPLIEAMQYGVPVLTSNTSSMPEAAGRAGLLVDPLSISSIRDGLVTLIGNPKYRQSLAYHAKAQAAKFTWENAAMTFIRVCQEAILIREATL
jgi:glycosyltransferase involved in cell wall biosynthesis